MFYLKTRKGRNLYIEDDNVFTTCPICGKPAKKMIYWGVAY